MATSTLQRVNAGRLAGMKIEPSCEGPIQTSFPYFFGRTESQQPVAQKGYRGFKQIIGDGGVGQFESILDEGVLILEQAFGTLDRQAESKHVLVELTLSEELQKWRESQHEKGLILPAKGHGLTVTSDKVIKYLRADNWPTPLLVNGALFGVGFSNMLIGAYDPETLFSNYCTDLSFYFEHSYHKVFPDYETLLNDALNDSHSLNTPGGQERRAVSRLNVQYIKCKIAFEERYLTNLTNKTLKLNWHDAMVLKLCDNSILGMAGELIARAFDPAVVVHDFIFSGPATDIIDVGSDLCNSEIVNSVLYTADMTDTGIVTEEALRRVYDAYAHASGRMWTERWSEPGVRMCATLYTWHIQNNRHGFIRRALLGFPKITTSQRGDQREAELDEVFDENLHTTGYSRPLGTACNGNDHCDQVHERVTASARPDLVDNLWWLLSGRILEYVRNGLVREIEEMAIAEDLRVSMAKMYSMGLVDDLAWLLAHANHHGWQINRLFEAAMWGSLLDDYSLRGRLDRHD